MFLKIEVCQLQQVISRSGCRYRPRCRILELHIFLQGGCLGSWQSHLSLYSSLSRHINQRKATRLFTCGGAERMRTVEGVCIQSFNQMLNILMPKVTFASKDKSTSIMLSSSGVCLRDCDHHMWFCHLRSAQSFSLSSSSCGIPVLSCCEEMG